MKRSILIRQRKGGVGKSAVAIALENALSGLGVTMRLIDADTPEAGEEGASFSGVFSDRAELFTIQPEMSRVEADPNELRRHWFPLCEAIMGGALVDFGANTNDAFDGALRDGGWAYEFQDAGTQIDVVLPVTANPEALKGGTEGIQAAREVLPSARIIVALSEKDGTFASYQQHPAFAALLAERERGVGFIHVPRCTSLLWRPIELARMDFVTAIKAATDDPAALGARLGMSRPEVRLGLNKLASWYDDVVKEFAAVGLLPSPAAPAKAKAKASE